MQRRLIALIALLALVGSATAQKTLTVWSGYPELEPFYAHVAAQFEADNPGVSIEILTQPLREYERRLLVTLPANSAGDVLEISSAFAARLVQNELIPPLSDDLAALVTGGAYADFYIENASFEGTVYGVPLFRGQGALFYNTEMFEAAGLAGPPTTMEEYVEYANVLTQRDASGEPTVSGWSLRLGGGGSGIAEKFWTIMHQFGGSIVTEQADGTWAADYANDAGYEALRLYVDLVNKDRVLTPELTGDAQGFQLGTTAMFIRESWVIGDIAAKAPDLPYATAVLPRGTISLPVNLYVTSSDPLASTFVEYVMRPENLRWLLENVGWLPNRQDVDYADIIAATPGLDGFINIPDDQVLFTVPPIEPIDEIQTRLAEHLVRAFTDRSLVDNEAGIRAVLQTAADETNEILRRAGLR
jgi:multiple sugar transport system substrate-binding protein